MENDTYEVARSVVEVFLSTVHEILYPGAIYDGTFVVDTRKPKNSEFMTEHNLSTADAYEVVERLGVCDYSHSVRNNRGQELHVFGAILLEHDLYVKLRLARQESGVLCVSFHPPERVMHFPYKN